ncbi:N-acetylmuramoyl-L-alanine amidase [Nodularia harveyana UHCC-0300]|uniref:N-acetylmuramoyl-L-alanine amidase n=1 Tax=Nodularia harveyana UHCC-0300 TaxID=2974287 RepID=A0ABU5UFB1_9CYAN|nr:N-acetylmuramoyl-L-alanine amidase [Nodularia harveyana]MEA5581775.1 N-acetylmuramoyl-L-alanine amidase [Nodularia harveyana UHCC-0300]
MKKIITFLGIQAKKSTYSCEAKKTIMVVKKHILHGENGKPVDFIRTPNKSGILEPFYLVMHYTANTSFDNTVKWFSQRRAKVSSHLVIGRDGRICQMVPFNRMAWHAGQSKWGELESLNRYSIGVELENAGKLERQDDGTWRSWEGKLIPDNEVDILIHKNESIATGWHTYTKEQISSSIKVAVALHSEYTFKGILGHDDIAPDRKIDPGPAFPMKDFISHVLHK